LALDSTLHLTGFFPGFLQPLHKYVKANYFYSIHNVQPGSAACLTDHVTSSAVPGVVCDGQKHYYEYGLARSVGKCAVRISPGMLVVYVSTTVNVWRLKTDFFIHDVTPFCIA
jgi:hypothetical protein